MIISRSRVGVTKVWEGFPSIHVQSQTSAQPADPPAAGNWALGRGSKSSSSDSTNPGRARFRARAAMLHTAVPPLPRSFVAQLKEISGTCGPRRKKVWEGFPSPKSDERATPRLSAGSWALDEGPSSLASPLSSDSTARRGRLARFRARARLRAAV